MTPHADLPDAPSLRAQPRGANQFAWRDAGQELLRLEWSKSNARSGLRCLPGFIIVLAIGWYTNLLAEAAAAVAATMSVGFGSFQRVGQSRRRVMLFVTVAISLAAFTGSLASQSVWGVTLVAAIWAFAYGLLTAWEAGISWIGLQCVIISVIAGGIPTDAHGALVRAGLTLAGGLVQFVLIVLIWRVLGTPHEEALGAPAEVLPAARREAHLETLRLHLKPGSPIGRYALQLSFALLVSASLYRLLHVPNGYWVPMTAVIVLKPGFRHTFIRGLARLAGTLIGVGLATLIAAALRPTGLTLCLLVVVFAWGSYALLQVNYGLFAICITAYVVFLLAFLGLPESQVVAHRLMNTALGGAIALVAYLLPLPRAAGENAESANP